MTPSRPYFLRALYDWIVANQLTPHVVVNATIPGVQVPPQHISDGKIVLNLSPHAVVDLDLGNTWVQFKARFSGVTRHIRLPMRAITAIYALENGRGMVFDHTSMSDDDDGEGSPPPFSTPPPARPNLKVVK